MSERERSLRSVEHAKKHEVEQQATRLAEQRRELAARDAALAELTAARDKLGAELAEARSLRARAHDVSALRWADAHAQALEQQRSQKNGHIARLTQARAQVVREIQRLERAFREAELSRRAVQGVIERAARAEQQRREQAHEDALGELSAALRRPPPAK